MTLEQSLQAVSESPSVAVGIPRVAIRQPPCRLEPTGEGLATTPNKRGIKRKVAPPTKQREGPPKKKARRPSSTRKKPRRRSSVSKARKLSPPPKHNGRKIRIGIIMTEVKSEQKKEELIPIGKKNRPWTRFAAKGQFIRRRWRCNEAIKNPAKKVESVPADVSIGLYIEYAYGGYGIEVDYIWPNELTEERCNRNDINFCLIYDLLEAYHLDRKVFEGFQSVLKNCNNIYPPLDYQEFINSKIKYYKFCQQNDINIAPTYTLSPEEYKAQYPSGGEQAADDLFQKFKGFKWYQYIAKPVYGQESKCLYMGSTGYAEHDGWMGTVEVKSEKKALAKYLDGVFGTADTPAKYPGLVFQKLIPDFGNGAKCPELRLYYVGGKYQYSMCSAGGRYLRPKEEGGKTDFPLDVLKPHTADIMTKLPKMIMQGKELPRLLDRFDMGYMIDGKPVTPYVNEIEFVPSLYIEDHPFVVEKELGDQMVNIALTLKGSSLDEMASYLEI